VPSAGRMPERPAPPSERRPGGPQRTSGDGAPAWAAPAPAGRSCRRGRGDRRRRPGHRVRRRGRRCRAGTNRRTTPRRCPPCRGAHRRSAESGPPGRRRQIRPPRCSHRGSDPARCSPSSGRRGETRGPRDTPRLTARPAPQTPTPPRSAVACPPSGRRRRRPRRRRAPRARRPVPADRCPARSDGASRRPARRPTNGGGPCRSNHGAAPAPLAV